jgi:hypothetical protein
MRCLHLDRSPCRDLPSVTSKRSERSAARDGYMQLSPLIRLLVWDYERGALAYDIVCLILLLLLLFFPPQWLHDPMVIGP